MTFISRSVLRTGVAAILLGSATLIPSADTRAESPLADCSQNAAIYYWKAAALIQTPTTRDELEYAGKADVLLADVSPAIFAAQPEMLQWLLNTGPMLPALRQARSCAICEFPIRTSSEPFLDLSHLPRLRALTHRALAMAKAYEFVDNAPGAAAIYVDLLKLVQHLDQDRNLISGFVAAELLQLNLSELESFFSRNPSAEAVAPLTEYFNALPSPVFHPGNYLRDEVRRYGDWLLADPARPEERLNRLYRNAKSKPAVEKLMTLDPQKKQAETERLGGRLPQADERAGRGRGPSVRVRPAAHPPARRAEGGRPSLPRPRRAITLSCRCWFRRPPKCISASCSRKRSSTCCKSFAPRPRTAPTLGSWPANIDAISRHARRMMPRDPFSGDKFYYRLERGMPVLITRVPKRMMSQKEYSYLLGIDQRLRIDEENTMNAARGIREKTVREISEPVPME